jgi:beta-phosphoglucomutase-like phosphatase (HAD superfamily)
MAAAKIQCDPVKCRGFEDGEIGLTALKAANMEAIDVRTFPGYPRS